MAAHTNRLASSTSPYLLQHAHNPVDWYPWGPEALGRAKAEDKPILLSVGYAACHWCHVMERESFEDDAIARLMNERFVCVKVDREERPDLDQVYQLVVQLMGRSGGWPLTVFLTPEERPFFAGTYFPPAPRYGMPSFGQVLDAVADAYANRRGELDEQAQEITDAIGKVLRTPPGTETVGPDLLARASRRLLARFDEGNGGFGGRPKFPSTMPLEVLLRRGALERDDHALAAVRRALERMQAGGIHDQLRGGFHRYSTDERWLVPHFEKMLYDNALLLRLYADGARVFDDPTFAETARDVVAYLVAEMRDASGAFYASQDADSEGEEGKFFVWRPEEVRAAVGDDDLAYDVARLVFGVTDAGNFEGSGASVLSHARSVESVAITLGVAPSEALLALERAKAKMLEAREKRPRPARDDKVLASWTALLVSALAEAGRALDEPDFVSTAVRALEAIEARLVDAEGRVGRYYKDGRVADAPGFLDDHAYVANAALDLYEATGEPRWIALARKIADRIVDHFGDDSDGGFFFAPDDGPKLIARAKDAFDQAIPSGSAIAAIALLRLGALVDERYAERAREQLDALGPAAVEDPFGHAQTVCALDRLVRGSVDLVLVGDASSPEFATLRRAVYRRYVANRNLVTVDPSRRETIDAAPLLARDKPAVAGKVVAYVCRDRTCSAPVDDPDALARMLE